MKATRSEIIIRDGIKILVARGFDAKGKPYYFFPGGKVDAGEAIVKASEREALEEVGVTVDGVVEVIAPLNAATVFYWPHEINKYTHIERHICVGFYTGKNTKALGTDDDSVAYEWCSPEQASLLIDTGFDITYNSWLKLAIRLALQVSPPDNSHTWRVV